VLILSFYVEFELFLLFWAFPSSFLPFWLALPLFLFFVGFCGFPSSRWPYWAFLGFLGPLAVLHGILDLNFKLCAFVVNGLIKGEIEKISDQFLSLIVMRKPCAPKSCPPVPFLTCATWSCGSPGSVRLGLVSTPVILFPWAGRSGESSTGAPIWFLCHRVLPLSSISNPELAHRFSHLHRGSVVVFCSDFSGASRPCLSSCAQALGPVSREHRALSKPGCSYQFSFKLFFVPSCQVFCSIPDLVSFAVGEARLCSCATGLKSLMICSLNCSPVVVSQTRPLGVQWNASEGINCSSIRFLSSISHVVLLTLFRASTAIPNPVLRADSLCIARWSWPSQKRGVSSQFRDIGQVPVRNFDWLPFTPLWSPFSIL
jgi:hypothetical protein